jgi:L-methionine (R)-S-oxide reductase
MTTNYAMLARQLDALCDGESDVLAISANFVSLLYAELEDVNWLGIYVRRGGELVLGPFQGLPACVHIPLGQGVCGSAAADDRTLLVDDVHQFDGHIACDPASNSELVVPLRNGDGVVGVLDIDSPSHGRFSAADQAGVEMLCEKFSRLIAGKPRAADGFI